MTNKIGTFRTNDLTIQVTLGSLHIITLELLEEFCIALRDADFESNAVISYKEHREYGALSSTKKIPIE